jgi:hypothetical protein
MFVHMREKFCIQSNLLEQKKAHINGNGMDSDSRDGLLSINVGSGSAQYRGVRRGL